MGLENLSAHQLKCDSTIVLSTPPSLSSNIAITSPSKYSSRSTDRVCSVSKIVSTLKTSFAESKKHEQRVRGRLARQINQTNLLAARLREEEKRNAHLCKVMHLDGLSDASSASESSDLKGNGIPPSAFHDLRDSFNSMSPMLIQYK